MSCIRPKGTEWLSTLPRLKRLYLSDLTQGVKCGSVTSCMDTAGPGIENYTQADKLYWTCFEERSDRRSCTDRKNRG